MSVYFSSDLHLGHRKVAEERGFDNPMEHDAAIYNCLEDTLKTGDQLWILGDMTVGGTAAEQDALYQLRTGSLIRGVELHLIAGNHDSCHPMANRNSHNRQRVFLETFTSVQLFARRKIGGQQVLLSHFPYRGDHTDEDRGLQYRLPDRGEWILHGHTHSSQIEDDEVVVAKHFGGDPIYKRRPNKQIHVGWDAWNRLMHLDEIAEIIARGTAALA